MRHEETKMYFQRRSSCASEREGKRKSVLDFYVAFSTRLKVERNLILFTSSFFLSTSSSCWISASETAWAAAELFLAQLAPAGSQLKRNCYFRDKLTLEFLETEKLHF